MTRKLAELAVVGAVLYFALWAFVLLLGMVLGFVIGMLGPGAFLLAFTAAAWAAFLAAAYGYWRSR